jgi:predicted phosphodiesterase
MYNLPESFEESFEHYHLPSVLENVGVMNDLHIPYHSIESIEDTIDYFIKKKVDSVFLNGDILDCYMLSKFNPDPRKRHFRDEIEAFKNFIGVLKANVTNNIYYKLGNHEEYRLFQTWLRLSRPIESNLYSYLGSKTIFNPHQFNSISFLALLPGVHHVGVVVFT